MGSYRDNNRLGVRPSRVAPERQAGLLPAPPAPGRVGKAVVGTVKDRWVLAAKSTCNLLLPPLHPLRELERGLGNVPLDRADGQAMLTGDVLVGPPFQAMRQEDPARFVR